MAKYRLVVFFMLFVCYIPICQCGEVGSNQFQKEAKVHIGNYRVVSIHDYSFEELLDEGINTLARQLDILHVPIRQSSSVIKWYIRRHIIKENRCNTSFRAISFVYPSVTPQGEPVMLSGLVTIPLLHGNTPSHMIIYHRLVCVSNTIAPSNSLPVEAVLTADNTICVFPDYYGCGVTQNNTLPYAAINYHARCATECALVALNIVHDIGIDLAPEFYTFNTGYSQGAGYALATHKYIETSLPDSLSRRINLRWSLCCNGVYSPDKLFESAILNNNMGSTPSIYLQTLRSLLLTNRESFDGISVRDFLSDKAIGTGIDSVLLTNDDGLWDLSNRLDGRDKSHHPADYFNPNVLDTSTELYRTIMAILSLDDCVTGWIPKSPVVISHSKKDNTIPFQLALMAQSQLSAENNHCILYVPPINGSHVFSAFLYYTTLLSHSEDELFHFYYPEEF